MVISCSFFYFPCQAKDKPLTEKDPENFRWGLNVKKGVTDKSLGGKFIGCFSAGVMDLEMPESHFLRNDTSSYHLSVLSSLKENPAEHIYWSANKDKATIDVSCTTPVIAPQNLKLGDNFIVITDDANNTLQILQLIISKDGKLMDHKEIPVSAASSHCPILSIILAVFGVFIVFILGIFVFLFYKNREAAASPKLLLKLPTFNVESIKNLIAEGELEAALKLLYEIAKNRDKAISEEIILLQSQLAFFQQEKKRGLLELDSYMVRKNRLVAHTMNLMTAS